MIPILFWTALGLGTALMIAGGFALLVLFTILAMDLVRGVAARRRRMTGLLRSSRDRAMHARGPR